jgi:hypothetical protein
MAAKFGLLIDAKTKGENNIKRLGNSMQGVEGKAKNLGMAVRGVGNAFKALFAAAAVAGFSAFVKGAIDSADAFGKLSTRTGIAADKLQAFANAGKLADVSQSDLETGLRTLARTQAEAADGVATYADAYAALGLSVKKADGSLKPSDQLLGEIADKFQDLPNGPEKAAVAMDIFGRSGSKLITLLNGGTEALERFNYETSENFAQNAEYFNDQITILQIQFDGFRKQLADALLPALNAILEVFSDLFTSGQDFTPLFQVIEAGIRGVASVVLGLVQATRFFVRTLQDLLKIATLVGQGKFGQAFDVAKTGLADTRAQFFKDLEAQGKVLFGRSEVGVAYGGGGRDSRPLTEQLEQTTDKTAGKTKEMSVDLAIYLADLEASVAAAEQLEAEQFAAGAAIAEQLNQQDKLNTELTETDRLFGSIKDTVATGLANAITGLIDGTKSLGESLSGILKQLGGMFLQFGMKTAVGAIFPSARGNVFAQNGIVPYANGGIINRPTRALMGEAGPEAVLPLQRGADGQLGVQVTGEAGMRAAMGRYSRRSGTTGAAAAAEAGAAEFGGVGGSGAIDVRYNVERINSVDYVTAEQFQAGLTRAAQQGAAEGERRAIGSMRNSPAVRRRVGV